MISLLKQDYNEHLLKCGLQCLIGTNCDAKNEVKPVQINDVTAISEVLNYGELLKESKYFCDIYSRLNQISNLRFHSVSQIAMIR